MIVGGKQGLHLHIYQCSHDSIGYGHAILGTGTSSNFIHDCKRTRGRSTKNEGGLLHLYEKGRFSASQIVTSPHSAEQSIGYPDLRRCCGDIAPNMCHDHNECILSEIGRFSCHVRSGDETEPFSFTPHGKAIRDKFTFCEVLFNHWVPPAGDIKGVLVDQFRSAVSIEIGALRKRLKAIDGGEELSQIHECQMLCCSVSKQFVVEGTLQRVCPFSTRHDFRLELNKAIGCITLCIHQCLLSVEPVGNLTPVSLGNLKVVAYDSVVCKLDGWDVRLFLQLCHIGVKPFRAILL